MYLPHVFVVQNVLATCTCHMCSHENGLKILLHFLLLFSDFNIAIRQVIEFIEKLGGEKRNFTLSLTGLMSH